MAKQIRIGSVLGIPLKLHLSWFLVFTFATIYLGKYYFPVGYPNLSLVIYWIMGVCSVLLIFVSIIVHELSHSYIALRYNLPMRGITLFVFGGMAEMLEEPDNPLTEFKMAVAGPLASLVLVLFFGILAYMVKQINPYLPLYGVLKYLSIINIYLIVFNAVPAYPLDGGRMLRAVIWYYTDDLGRATLVASKIGSGFGMTLIAFGLLALLFRFYFGLWPAFIGMFLKEAARMGYRQTLMRMRLEGVKVAEIMTAPVVSIPADITLGQLVDEYFMRYHFSNFPVKAGERLLGLISLDDVKCVQHERWNEVKVGDVVNKDILDFKVGPLDDAMAALSLMARNEVGRIPVLSEGVLVGIITRRDIMKLL